MPRLNLSAEDCIAVIDLATPELAPDPLLIARLGQTAADLDAWKVIWDLRSDRNAMDAVYNDQLDAYAEVVALERTRKTSWGATPTLLVNPEHEEEVADALRLKLGWGTQLQVLGTKGKELIKRPFDLTPFSDEWTGAAEDTITPADVSWGHGVDEKVAEDLLRGDASAALALGIVADEDEARQLLDDLLVDDFTMEEAMIRVEEEVQSERATLLDVFLRRIASNSLLAQIAFVQDADRISVVPMHGNGLHDLECAESLLTVRPARRGSASQWRRFEPAIGELEELINTPGVKEAEIEALLVRNPQFLRGLNYAETYHQVVLPLGDGQSLRPDVIAEPVSKDWCDVIDLKLPSEPVFVGGGDRPRLSQAIAQAASQLRQYAKWFDDRKVAGIVEEMYGFRCYRPRQVVIIGRDPRRFTEAQRDAARSAYADLEIVTYDQLLNAARSRLLF